MKGLTRYREQVLSRMVSAVTSCTQRAESQARLIVPYGDGRDGGHLRDCISSAVQEEKGLVTGMIAARNPHALYVELGTSRMAAQPYLRPALKSQKEVFLNALKK